MAGRQQLIDAGLAALQQGDMDAAERSFDAVVKRTPRDSIALMYLGLIAQARGAFDKARALMEKAIKFGSGEPRLHNNYAQLLMTLGEPAQAAGQARLATELNPTYADAWCNLGLAHAAMREDGPAVEALERAAALAPGDAKIQFNLGWALAEAGRFDDSVTVLGKAVRLQPNAAKIRVALGDVEVRRRALDSALRQYQEAERLEPGVSALRQRQGDVYRQLGRFDDAIDRYRAAVELEPDNPALRLDLGYAELQFGEREAARDTFERAASRAGDIPPALANAAIGLAAAGDADGARALIEDRLAAKPDDPDLALAFGTLSERTGKTGAARTAIDRALDANAGLGPDQRRSLLFVLARLEDEDGDIDSAFAHAEEANTLRGAEFDRAIFDALIERLINSFSRKRLADLPRANTVDERPVLVVGMQRSGVATLGRILGAHPNARDLGERAELALAGARLGSGPNGYLDALDTLASDDLEKAARTYLDRIDDGSGALRVIERIPANLLQLGLAQLLLPGARAVLVRRDPVDTCLSCYFQDFAGAAAFAFDLDDLAHVYRQMDRVSRHWQAVLDLPISEVAFEALVRDPVATARALGDALGLPATAGWPGDGVAATAGGGVKLAGLGAEIASESVGRGQRYAKHLERLVERLAAV